MIAYSIIKFHFKKGVDLITSAKLSIGNIASSKMRLSTMWSVLVIILTKCFNLRIRSPLWFSTKWFSTKWRIPVPLVTLNVMFIEGIFYLQKYPCLIKLILKILYINIIWPFWAVVSFFDFEEYNSSFKKATEIFIKTFNQPSFLGKNVFYYFTIFTSWTIADKQTIIKTRNCHYNILLLWNW